ncbi:Lipase 2 [Corynebacterium provencense]|uniref:Lipase 2 n=1 Tax=Corynebacterium provencense TaxID=1737425 RepID=A0A2Z3YS81_9CORY|nr:esterase [Corynebacterium provencense]AWT25424.1 Lipase 2 [Corynebacterium provencense]
MKKLFRSVSAAAVAAAAALSLGLGSGPAVADPAPAPVPAPADIPVPTTPEQLLEQISRYAPPVSFTNPLQGSGPKQLVTFGDSFTAIAGKNGSRGEEPGQLPWTFNCSTDMDNWPKVAARQANVSLGDWSCNGMGGAPLVQLVAYLESAIFYGDIGPGTKDVALMYGGMDTFQWIDTAGLVFGSQPTTPVFDAMMAYVKQRVETVAPGAKVTLLSYPELANGDDICFANVSPAVIERYLPGVTVPDFPEITAKVTVPGAKHIQESLRDNIKHAADVNGLGFVDMYQATIGHGPCNPVPAERYTVGVVDTQVSTMPNHPTFTGSEAMGKIFAQQVYNR